MWPLRKQTATEPARRPLGVTPGRNVRSLPDGPYRLCAVLAPRRHPGGPMAVKLAGSGDRLTSKGSRTAVLMTDGAIRRNSSACANNLLRCVQKVKYRAGAR